MLSIKKQMKIGSYANNYNTWKPESICNITSDLYKKETDEDSQRQLSISIVTCNVKKERKRQSLFSKLASHLGYLPYYRLRI